jgi:hypothetical protein
MTNTVISNNVTMAVTIGIGGIQPNLTITSNGTIDPGLTSGGDPALTLPAGGAYATILNQGKIISGSYGTMEAGAEGVLIAGAAKFSNTGKIFGANGEGTATSPNGGAGGAGISISSAASGVVLSNAGTIGGGAGGYGSTGGNGGSGLLINTAHIVNLSNTGLIEGGAAGQSEIDMFGMGPGGTGGAGLRIIGDKGGAVTNGAGGVILGGKGSFSQLGNATLGTPGGDGLADYAGATITNHGHITGGTGGFTTEYGRYAGGAGGTGALIGLYKTGSVQQSGSLINTGDITGGEGAVSNGAGAAGSGGSGLRLAGSASNAGVITGGLGASTTYDGAGGAGGTAVVIYTRSQLLNTGTLAGGNGGEGAPGAGYTVSSGTGGDGVVISKAATLVNSGVIKGGAGGAGTTMYGYAAYNGNGGDGVVIASGGVLNNAGTIIAGKAGDNPAAGPAGLAGAAVTFEGAGIVIAAKGAVFEGSVLADSAASDGLELTGTSGTALTGFGTQFENFNTIAFAAGAARTIDGNKALLHPGITGFAAGDGIDLNFITFSSADQLKVSHAGTLSVITPGGIFGLRIADAAVDETDFTLKKSSDGILIGKAAASAGARMNFVAPPTDALLPAPRWWAPAYQSAPAATLTASFTVLHDSGAIFETSTHFNSVMMPAISLQAGFG